MQDFLLYLGNLIPMPFVMTEKTKAILAILLIVIGLLCLNSIIKGINKCCHSRWTKRLKDFQAKVRQTLDDLDADGSVHHEPTPLGHVDHVMISRKGVFVIMEIYYSGTVHGGNQADYWEVVDKHYVESVDNPVLLIKEKVKGLAQMLQCNPDVLIPVIVFPDDTELRISTDIAVLHVSALAAYIQAPFPYVIPEEDVEIMTRRYAALQDGVRNRLNSTGH